jgi:putative oxidoreductase
MSKLNSSSITAFVDTGISLFVLRVFAAGFMLFGHGWGKLMMVVNGNFEFLDPIGLGPEITLIFAAFAEAICAIMILFGFYTRFAALILVLNMAGAVFLHHFPAGDGFGGMEAALLYLLLFFVIFLTGPGSFAADSKSR